MPRPPRTLHLIRQAHRLSGSLLSTIDACGSLSAPLAVSLNRLTPEPTLVLSSPLSRALSTALDIAGSLEVHAEPLLTEQGTRACDMGRPSSELHQEFRDLGVKKLAYMGTAWWTSDEADEALAERVSKLIGKLHLQPHTSLALVSHAAVLQQLERSLMSSDAAPPPALEPGEVRSVAFPDTRPPAFVLKPFQDQPKEGGNRL